MAIFHIPPPRKWSHKHIILVTLVGSLVFIAITAAIAISLSPAHIFFSIKDPTFAKADEDTKFYNFTLVVNNSSPGMEVHYGALSAELWYSDKAWVPAKVDGGALLDGTSCQPPRNVTSIAVSAEYWQSEQTSTPPPLPGSGEKPGTPPPSAPVEWSNCTVLVTASVWFKSRWWISTRWYDVRANCTPVNFGSRSTSPVSCE
ncbi:hypothetical protein GQ55_3G057600 [Panicum hallii var. hallii]|uniref:Late embryogenesis abundant protein LEA-2 subgroup domain-containing protein n=1 Tax=Panicum hallii var. hallii TaxID=1504633 RepID=A0A2T7E658_9POAL|nr:hypothetical protein GQ55_3G057600 [Panicum hallii var. hallii]